MIQKNKINTLLNSEATSAVVGCSHRQHTTPKVLWILFFVALLNSSCNKLVEIDPPVNTISTQLAFRDSISTNSSVLGIYAKMQYTGGSTDFYNGRITEAFGLYSDELTSANMLEYLSAKVSVDNAILVNQLWGTPYNMIFHANSCIEGIAESKGMSEAVKLVFTAEAKFVRAYSFFYLVNIYGRAPFPLSSKWIENAKLPALDSAEVYKRILSDLEMAFNGLPEDYSRYGDERVRANKYAAAALMARVHLYRKDYEKADFWASKVINKSSLYSLADSLSDVFNRNGKESILQLQLTGNVYPFDCTAEAVSFIPTGSPQYALSEALYQSFQDNDRRREKWIGEFEFNNTKYYYPYKYTVRNPTPNVQPPQYYTLLRLSETLLIRAEAKCMLNDLEAGTADLNAVRVRAGLTAYPGGTKEELLSSIVTERRHELFCELGHRWFDIKRLGLEDEILSKIKPNWSNYRRLLPIPIFELQKNPALVQNNGY